MGIRVTPLEVPLTPRLAHEAVRWQVPGNRPANIAVPGPGQESVWDYPRPPAMQRVDERITIVVAGQTIAQTNEAIRVCETASPPTYYLPRAAFAADCLRPAAGGSACEWKGMASYWTVVVGEVVAQRAAWSYEAPCPEYGALVGMVSVYPAATERCTVGSHEVTAQPGHFYGGWITDDLTGPFKGEPGSSAW